MKLHIEMDSKEGIRLRLQLHPPVLRVVLQLTAGIASLSWLLQLGMDMGWL